MAHIRLDYSFMSYSHSNLYEPRRS